MFTVDNPTFLLTYLVLFLILLTNKYRNKQLHLLTWFLKRTASDVSTNVD